LLPSSMTAVAGMVSAGVADTGASILTSAYCPMRKRFPAFARANARLDRAGGRIELRIDEQHLPSERGSGIVAETYRRV